MAPGILIPNAHRALGDGEPYFKVSFAVVIACEDILIKSSHLLCPNFNRNSGMGGANVD